MLGCCGAALSSLLQVLVSQAGSQDTVIFTICSEGDGSVSLGETSAAAAPGLLRADIVAGRCFGSRSAWCTQSLPDTRHNLAVSLRWLLVFFFSTLCDFGSPPSFRHVRHLGHWLRCWVTASLSVPLREFMIHNEEDCGLQVRVLSCWMVLRLPRSCCRITSASFELRMSRIFAADERRLFLSLRRRNHLVSDVG